MTESLRRLAPAAYVTALYFIVTAMVDAVANGWPLHLGDEQGRYEFAAIVSGYIVSVLFGLIISAIIAALLGQRWALWTTGILSLLVALLFLVAEISFVLDVLQLHGMVRDEAADAFRIGSEKTGFKFAFFFLCTLLIGIGALRGAKVLAPARHDR